jgi:N-acyl-D-amino-acid deacylase
MHDLVIRGGTIVDGTGRPGITGDVAISGGVVTDVGALATTAARRTLDADGALVAPGWVDIHTHYDGQVTWDDQMEPSAANGVTTLVMGNCGVGFAPVRPGGERTLIELMEGVEDIPGTALYEGMPWGSWESFGEYLDVLGSRSYSLDIAAQIAHGAVRAYVMGERGIANEDATPDDLVAMADVVARAMQEGAVGFSTLRTIGHRAITGEPVPGTFAAEDELAAIAGSMGRGVFEAIVAGTVGALEPLGGERSTTDAEVQMLARLSQASGRPITFTCVQLGEDPTGWRRMIDAARAANDVGARLHPQVANRQIGFLGSLSAYHPFMCRPTYRALSHLPLPQRIAELSKPDIKTAILGEPDERTGSFNGGPGLAKLYARAVGSTYEMTDPMDYEPTRSSSIAGRASAAGVDAMSLYYDLLLQRDGTSFFVILGSNYASGSLDVCREMLLEPHTVTGLSDAGAHVNLICDVAMPTFNLTFWSRDRAKGEGLPIEHVVHKQTLGNARLYGFDDRGVIAPGMRADINVIDHGALRIEHPIARTDLPAGGSRVMQLATGYLATVVNGTVTRERDHDTGARPGRLARSRA